MANFFFIEIIYLKMFKYLIKVRILIELFYVKKAYF